MSENIVLDARADISEGCPMTFTVDGTDMAHVVFGESRTAVELVFDMASLRSLVEGGSRAMAEMDARYERQHGREDVRPDATPP